MPLLNQKVACVCIADKHPGVKRKPCAKGSVISTRQLVMTRRAEVLDKQLELTPQHTDKQADSNRQSQTKHINYHCRSAMICRDDLELRWRLPMCENEFSHVSLLLCISTAF